MIMARGKEHRYLLGTLDYNRSGRRDYSAVLTWQVSDEGEFTMCGEVFHTATRSVRSCGQNVDRVVAYFPHNAKAQRMLAIWERWHLNHLRAGSQVQEDWLRAHPLDPASYAYPKSHYQVASDALAAAGLNPDPEGYRYGSAWKTEPLPAEVLAEINSWSAPVAQPA
jgi:hypothetical protein